VPSRRTSNLQLHRQSVVGASYFITCCTERRNPKLAHPEISRRLLFVVKDSDFTGDTQTFAFTVMPDHCHWLFRLHARLSLGQVVAKFKSLTRAALSSHHLEWQRNYYEHQLRPEEAPEAYGLYVFLNPYRAMLLSGEQTWPAWWTGSPDALSFMRLLNPNGSPPAEWIIRADPVGLCTGE
jgi:putative transposase